MAKQAPALLVFLGLALTATGLAPARGAEDAPTVEVVPLEGPRLRGQLQALDGESLTLLTPGGERRYPLGQIRSLETGATALEPGPHLRLHLLGGEVLKGTYAGDHEEGISLRTPAGKVDLSFEVLRSLVVVPAGAGPCFEPESRFTPRDGEDVLYLEGGDAHAGLLLGVDAEGFRLEGERGVERRIPWAGARVLHLENEDPAPVEGLRVEVETRDGSRWIAAAPPTLVAEGLRFALRSSPQLEVTVPLEMVTSLRPSGGHFVYACHLPFESTFETPYARTPGNDMEAAFLQAWFGTRVDRRPSGCPLRLAGQEHRYGFAVHARSRVRIPIDAGFRQFSVLFGIDDEALEVPVGGVVDARVLVDDAVRWEANDVRGGEAPRAIGPLDVSGAKVIVLEVDFGSELHVRDRATWADPILVR